MPYERMVRVYKARHAVLENDLASIVHAISKIQPDDQAVMKIDELVERAEAIHRQV